MIRKIRLFMGMNKELRVMIINAYILSGYYRFKMLFKPFNKLALEMGELGVEDTKEADDSMNAYIYKVRRAVMLASKYTPWESLCMVQALVAKHMLNKKNIDNVIYFGLAKNEKNEPIAHAWLKYNNKVVVGEKGMERFSVVATFGSVH